MGVFNRYRALPLWQKIAGWIAVGLILYTLFGFFAFPRILRSLSSDKLTEILHRQTTISRITFNPYTLILTMEGFNIRERDSDETFASLGHCRINLAAGSIFKLGPVIQDILFDDIHLNIIRKKDMSYNFSDLVPAGEGETAEGSGPGKESGSAPVRFYVSNIMLKNGNVTITDNPTNKTHRLSRMELAIPFISNMEAHTDIFVTPHFSVDANGTPIELKARSKPFTDHRTTILDLSLKDLDLPYYYAYNPVPLNMDLAAGTMDLSCMLEFAMPAASGNPPSMLISGGLEVRELDIDGPDTTPLLDLDRLSIKLDRSEVLKGRIVVDDVTLAGPRLALIRSQQGGLNLHQLMDQKSSGQHQSMDPSEQKKNGFPISLACRQVGVSDMSVTLSSGREPQDVLSIDRFLLADISAQTDQREITLGAVSLEKGVLDIFRLEDGTTNLAALSGPVNDKRTPPADTNASSPASGQDPEDPWTVNLNQLDLEEVRVAARDLIESGKGSVALDHISLDCKGLSNRKGQLADASLSFNLNEDGRITAAGKVGISPVNLDLELISEDIRINGFQDFISNAVNMMIAGGTLSSKGRLNITTADGGMNTRLQGDYDISGFNALDSTTTTDLFSFGQLAVKGLDLETRPFHARIKEIAVTDPLSALVIAKDGTSNFGRISKSSGQNQAAPEQADTDREVEDDTPGQADDAKSKTGGIPLEIGQVVIENGGFEIQDQSITPNFKARFGQVKSRVTGLSGKETIRSDLELNALVNNHTPVKIKGKINPLKEKFFCDLQLALSDMDLGFLTPYAGKYAGYTIKKGKMTLDLEYLIDQRKLDSKNDLFLDQFSFGEKTNSEDAVNAPVTLAVSLLKDPAGRISLNLPVKGDLDDPEFRVGGIIVQMIMNLLVKAATAPFSLLGSMFGGGEDLNLIAFDPGSTHLGTQASGKIETLIKALSQRPGLSLEIAGFVDADPDRAALENKAFDQVLKGEKLKSLVAMGNPAVPVETIEVSDEEHDQYLRAAFDRTEAGMAYARRLLEAEQQAAQAAPAAGAAAGQADAGTAAAEDATVPAGQIAQTPSMMEKIPQPTREEMSRAVRTQIRITNDDLRHLAQDRSLAVKSALLADPSIDPGRIFTIESRSLAPEDSSLPKASVIMTLK